jgi:hypothetical protein
MTKAQRIYREIRRLGADADAARQLTLIVLSSDA